MYCQCYLWKKTKEFNLGTVWTWEKSSNISRTNWNIITWPFWFLQVLRWSEKGCLISKLCMVGRRWWGVTWKMDLWCVIVHYPLPLPLKVTEVKRYIVRSVYLFPIDTTRHHDIKGMFCEERTPNSFMNCKDDTMKRKQWIKLVSWYW